MIVTIVGTAFGIFTILISIGMMIGIPLAEETENSSSFYYCITSIFITTGILLILFSTNII